MYTSKIYQDAAYNYCLVKLTDDIWRSYTPMVFEAPMQASFWQARLGIELSSRWQHYATIYRERLLLFKRLKV